MNNFKNLPHLKMLLLSMLVTQISFAAIPDSMEIYTVQTRLNVGEPLSINLTFMFNQPNILKKTGEISPILTREGLTLQILSEDKNEPFLVRGLFPRKFTLEGVGGTKYMEQAMVFYDWSAQKVIFDKPGTYKIAVLDAKKRSSNQIEILVESSYINEQALSMLSDPNDFAFLMHGLYESKASKECLEQITSQHKGTLLAKLAAARLGIEYSKTLQKKYSNGEDFKANYNEGRIVEPLVAKSYSYLLAAIGIPDEFPVKEEVLFHLISLEILKENYQKAVIYANELGERYSKGKYGKNAAKIRNQILEFESDQTR